MPAVMKKSDAYPRWVTLEHPTFGDFEVKLRRPTAMESATDDATLMRSFNADREDSIFFQTQRRQFRAFGLVMDWRGVVDDEGAAVPFTPENLAAFVGMYPAAFVLLSTLGDEVMAGKVVASRNGWSESNGRPVVDSSGADAEGTGRELTTTPTRSSSSTNLKPSEESEG